LHLGDPREIRFDRFADIRSLECDTSGPWSAVEQDEGAFATLLSGISPADQVIGILSGVDTLFAMQRDFSCLNLRSTACGVLFGMAADAAGIEGVENAEMRDLAVSRDRALIRA
jgi:hypothetical protein